MPRGRLANGSSIEAIPAITAELGEATASAFVDEQGKSIADIVGQAHHGMCAVARDPWSAYELCLLRTSSTTQSLTFPRLRSQRELALKNLALRRQLAVLKRSPKRPKLTHADRAFWVALSRLWTGWQHALILVKPETVIRWHRKGFRLYWTWKGRHRGGRPPIDAEIRALIRRRRGPRDGLKSLSFVVSKDTETQKLQPVPNVAFRAFGDAGESSRPVRLGALAIMAAVISRRTTF